ncbi:BufA2 family periplasmic bufferin-type metallophore [Sphingomonas sp. UYP23]
MKTFKTGAAIASAAAMFALTGLAMTAPAQAAGKTAKVQPCYGVNSCKGTSDCKSGTHDCKGQNDCKGQGFKDLSTKACAKMGGSLTPQG